MWKQFADPSCSWFGVGALVAVIFFIAMRIYIENEEDIRNIPSWLRRKLTGKQEDRK